MLYCLQCKRFATIDQNTISYKHFHMRQQYMYLIYSYQTHTVLFNLFYIPRGKNNLRNLLVVTSHHIRVSCIYLIINTCIAKSLGNTLLFPSHNCFHTRERISDINVIGDLDENTMDYWITAVAPSSSSVSSGWIIAAMACGICHDVYKSFHCHFCSTLYSMILYHCFVFSLSALVCL